MGRKVPLHLVVLGHPSAGSFNAALANRYAKVVRAQHHDAVVRDLYAIGFDPLLKESERTANGVDGETSDVQAELNLLNQCDILTFVYPLWFGMPPAVIKGYIDRVLGAGFRVDQLGQSPQGLLRGKQLSVITTSGSRIHWLEEHGMWVSLRQSFDEYLRKVFGFARCDHYHADSIVEDLADADADRIFYEVEEFARAVCASAAARQRL
jgi:NAD(P)H dehydrogenase (quinone)